MYLNLNGANEGASAIEKENIWRMVPPYFRILQCRMRFNIIAFLIEVSSVWTIIIAFVVVIVVIIVVVVILLCAFSFFLCILYSYKIFMFSYLAHPIVMVLSVFSFSDYCFSSFSFSLVRVFFLFHFLAMRITI